MAYAREDVGAAALVVVAVAAVTALLAATSGYTAAELARADPLVQVVRGPWPDIGIAFALGCAAFAVARPDRAALARGARLAVAGVVVAAVVVVALRLTVGSTLPSFIPAEESARPGLVLGATAGVVEEAVFRLAVLPGALALLSRRLRPVPALLAAALVTGLLFALSHELGPAPFDAAHFATRTLIPGFVMSVLYVRVGPAFIVTAHCVAHFMIPFAFY